MKLIRSPLKTSYIDLRNTASLSREYILKTLRAHPSIRTGGKTYQLLEQQRVSVQGVTAVRRSDCRQLVLKTFDDDLCRSMLRAYFVRDSLDFSRRFLRVQADDIPFHGLLHSIWEPIDIAHTFYPFASLSIVYDAHHLRRRAGHSTFYRDSLIVHEMRIAAADLFALCMFICETLLQIGRATTGSPRCEKDVKAIRFFLIVTRLPIELQTLVCNQAQGLRDEFISQVRVDNALGKLAYRFRQRRVRMVTLAIQQCEGVDGTLMDILSPD